MPVMAKTTPQQIREMSYDKKQSAGDFETFQLDVYTVQHFSWARQAKNFVVCNVSDHDVVASLAILFCLCSIKIITR